MKGLGTGCVCVGGGGGGGQRGNKFYKIKNNNQHVKINFSILPITFSYLTYLLNACRFWSKQRT